MSLIDPEAASRPFALDLGSTEKSTTGWAYWDGEALHGGCWDLTMAGTDFDAKLVYFSKRVRHALTEIKPRPTMIVCEEPGIMKSNHTTLTRLHSMLGIVRLWSMAMLDRRARLIHPMTLKKACTGSGKADKGAIMRAVKSRHEGLELRDDNHADAVAMVDLILDEARGTGFATPMIAAMAKAAPLPERPEGERTVPRGIKLGASVKARGRRREA